MSKEGYLIKHDIKNGSEVLYFELGEGFLRYYTRRGGFLLEEIRLSGSKLTLRAIDDILTKNCPHSFQLIVQPHRMVKGRRKVNGDPTVWTLSAPSEDEKSSWGNTIYSWQRHCWSEPEIYSQISSPQDIDKYFRDQHTILSGNLVKYGSSMYRKLSYGSSKDVSAQSKRPNFSIGLPSPAFSTSYTFQQSA